MGESVHQPRLDSQAKSQRERAKCPPIGHSPETMIQAPYSRPPILPGIAGLAYARLHDDFQRPHETPEQRLSERNER